MRPNSENKTHLLPLPLLPSQSLIPTKLYIGCSICPFELKCSWEDQAHSWYSFEGSLRVISFWCCSPLSRKVKRRNQMISAHFYVSSTRVSYNGARLAGKTFPTCCSQMAEVRTCPSWALRLESLDPSIPELVFRTNSSTHRSNSLELAEYNLFKSLSVSRKPPAKRKGVQGTFHKHQIEENFLDNNDGLVFLTWAAIQLEVIGNGWKNSGDRGKNNKYEQDPAKFVLEGEDLVNFHGWASMVVSSSAAKNERFVGLFLKRDVQ